MLAFPDGSSIILNMNLEIREIYKDEEGTQIEYQIVNEVGVILAYASSMRVAKILVDEYEI